MATKIRSSQQLYIDEDLQFNSKKGVGLKKGTVAGDAVEFDQLQEKVDKVTGKSLIADTDIAKLAPITVAPDLVTVDRNMRVEGTMVFKTFTFSQGLPLAVWTINHKMERVPSVVVTDSAGTTVEGNIRHVDENNTVISFNAAFSGNAYFN